MANLSGKEIYRFEWITEVFLDMYKNQKEFTLTNKKKMQFAVDDDIIKAVKRKQSTTPLVLLGLDGNEYKFSQIEKTKEFGGLDPGATVAKEMVALNTLKEYIAKAKVKEKSPTIKIKVKNTIYDVYDAVSTPGVPKSDFHLVDIDGKELVWISHKDGEKPSDFQQWSGVTERHEPQIYRKRETKNYINDVKLYTKGEMPQATTIAREITKPSIKSMAVFGQDYGKAYGRQNVHIVVQGKIKLFKRGNFYYIGGKHVTLNGQRVYGDYEPVYMTTYRSDRSNFNIKNARFSIQAKKSRKIDVEL
jgi:hypothetical protein